ncbi:MAG: acetyl-CoA carboxylase biotin carboxylase subunit, partial [Planctomycetota bacterium]
PNYDSMIGKLICHRPTRAEAIATAKRALTEFDIAPIATTIPLHLRLLDDKNFQAGDVDTKYIEREVLDGK